MKDPATITAAALVGAGSAGLGHVLGFPVDALMLGLVGAVSAVMVLPAPTLAAKGPLRQVAAVAGMALAGVLAAGGLGPITAEMLHADKVDRLTELRAYSFMWGSGVTVLLPTAINALRNRIRQAGGLSASEDSHDTR